MSLPSLEVRHLDVGARRRLNELLDVDESWRTLAGSLRRPDSREQFLVTAGNVRILEQQRYVAGGSPSAALIDYWATCARKRPTLQDLVNTLIECRLYRAADFVAVDVLGQQPIDRDSNCCSDKFIEPSAPTVSLSSIDDRRVLATLGNLQDVERLDFAVLERATAGFADRLLADGGCKLGEGAFGSVYRVKLDDGGTTVAAKVLSFEFAREFCNEVEAMAKFDHENLLRLRGISLNGADRLALIFDYMANGSLSTALNNTGTIDDQRLRLAIAIGAARGIRHLHTFLDKPLVHRDVKSDNILLDANWCPKLGDFGLARVGTQGSGQTTSRNLTQNVIGTTVYMAPEAFRGDVSIKLDVFSFGVVLLELVTGLRAYDEQRDEHDLLSYVDENADSENDLKDVRVDWTDRVSSELFRLARLATEQRKKLRPSMVDLLPQLEALASDDDRP